MSYIDLIIKAMDGELPGFANKDETQVFAEDMDITTTESLIEGLKSGKVPGNAIIEWEDGQGKLRANVVDFLFYEEFDGFDVKTMETMKILQKFVPDGSWKLFY